ncbi:hypothetical protein [Schlesneria paludicola]|uniref:hypothetical protein n=1 Tax=Schlesneria paludicola TaxID=360056 RepID=UPI00029A9BB7|nr:hypothetical protein [Schlesneria paludicola]
MIAPDKPMVSITTEPLIIEKQSELLNWVRRLQVIAGYLIISSVTIPFAGRYWYGELPILALIQLPKLLPAEWLRTHVVMPLIRALGMSAGSFSPDYLMARPYALLLSYLIPAVILAGLLATSHPPGRTIWRWYFIVVVLMTIDGMVMLAFGNTRTFTMY